MSRRAYRGDGPAQWHITVATPDNDAVLFHGATSDPGELRALAVEARRLRPEALIWLRSPAGQVTAWA